MPVQCLDPGRADLGNRRRGRDADFRGANLFWWFNMYSGANIGVTPRPMYPADGRKIPDVYTTPPQLRERLTKQLGTFPLFNFWGPATSIAASRWIADCTNDVLQRDAPDLTLVYIPHLDYDGQRYGPDSPQMLRALSQVDAVCGELIAGARARGHAVIVLSEYGLVPVNDAIMINQVLRRAGLVQVRCELGREILDAGASEAFAVADHQIAHVHVRRSERIAEVRELLRNIDGVEQVWQRGEPDHPLDHARAGDLVAISRSNRWFCYYYWLDDDVAPDFARCVDIHRKPGYDPVELFLDPRLRFPKLEIGRRLLAKRMGFRRLMDVIPLAPQLVRGSHGRTTDDPADGPLLISSDAELVTGKPIAATAVKSVILDHVFGPDPQQRSRHARDKLRDGATTT